MGGIALVRKTMFQSTLFSFPRADTLVTVPAAGRADVNWPQPTRAHAHSYRAR
jgi:hypothetical protein